jgi:hypothetical protein
VGFFEGLFLASPHRSRPECCFLASEHRLRLESSSLGPRTSMAMNLAGIAIDKANFIARMRLRYEAKLDSLPPASPQHMNLFEGASAGLDLETSGLFLRLAFLPLYPNVAAADPEVARSTPASAVNAYLVQNKMLMNKIEVENLFDHFGAGKERATVDMDAFLVGMRTLTGGEEPVWRRANLATHLTSELKCWQTHPPVDSNDAHIALSGVSHIEFGEQWKAFPKHWGIPPNGQMKGHDGIVRDLPGGYGKGNAPMYNWVMENMQKDKRSSTNERGQKPYPYGNYSL